MSKSAKENFRFLSLIVIGILIIFVGTIMLFSGSDTNPYTMLDLGPDIVIKFSTTQQLLVGGICFVSVIVLFGKRNQHP
jgi:hypothetical protein